MGLILALMWDYYRDQRSRAHKKALDFLMLWDETVLLTLPSTFIRSPLPKGVSHSLGPLASVSRCGSKSAPLMIATADDYCLMDCFPRAGNWP